MNAKAQALTPAAVNRALDKINANPAKRGKQVFVPTRSKQKAIDYAKEKHGIDAGIAVKAQGGFIVYQAYDTNPARKTRAVRVVAANPVRRPKSLYVVWTAAADGIKHERLATFEKLSEARKYAQAYADSSGKKMIVETKAL